MVITETIVDSIYEGLKPIYDSESWLYEVSLARSPILKQIDLNFRAMKIALEENDNKRLQDAVKDLQSNMKLFMGVKRVTVKIQRDYYNAGVIPTYSRFLPMDLNLWQWLKKVIKQDVTFKSDESVTDSKYIQSTHIILGDTLIRNSQSRELTAILLHEIGHIYAHTSNFPQILAAIVRVLSSAGLVVSVFKLLSGVSFKITAPITLTLFTISRSLSFLDHAGEYQADKYAAKYGYAEEMIRVLNKFKMETDQVQRNKRFILKLSDFISQLFFPSIHPTDKDRMCKLSNAMIDQYKEQYPKIKKDISIILSDLKC